MKRLFDIFLSVSLIIFFTPIFLVLALTIKITSKGPIIFWSQRVGQNNEIFMMPKFRSMKVNTPLVASHLLQNPKELYSPLGFFLRSSSLDELPQLYSVLRGDMSFVGPRPALFNQYDLIELRTSYGIHLLRPGITGLAQIIGRDDLSINEKVKFDYEYLKNRSLYYDLKILVKTFQKVFFKEGVSH